MDVARTGLLITVPADSVAGAARLSWVDRQGQGQPLRLPLANYGEMKLSPAGDRVALSVGNGLSIVDLERLSISKLTLAKRAEQPVWSPDGRRLYFGYEEGKSYQIFSKAADDSGTPQLVVPSEMQDDPYAVSRDGSKLLVQLAPASGNRSLAIHDLRDPKSDAKVLFSSLDLGDSNFDFSPDDRWVVYPSGDSGGSEIHVRPSSGDDRKWQVSVDGGNFPVWSPAGDEIFFLCGVKMMAVPVSARGDELVIGEPRVLFENHRIRTFDVSRDGRRFLVVEDPNPEAQSRLDLVIHWAAEAARKVMEARTP
jgi:hypothetical protein